MLKWRMTLPKFASQQLDKTKVPKFEESKLCLSVGPARTLQAYHIEWPEGNRTYPQLPKTNVKKKKIQQ